MTTLTRAPASSPATASRTLRVAGVALLVTALAVAAIALLSTREHDTAPAGKVLASQSLGFSMSYGNGWAAVPATKVAKLPSKPAAMLRRADRRGLVTVRQTAAGRMADPRGLAAGLRKELARRFPDFRAVSARVVPVRAGRAFLFTFVRTRSRAVQTIAVTSVGTRTFQLEAVVAGSAPEAAREAADILSSFGPAR